MRTLTLGILAHVDAGKTSLTERLLYAAGVIDALGRVDDGSTQTDSLALERQRGITIKSAVVSFTIGDVAVNLIDTPGHPDFIAEVERALWVLDGAVLVLSAVEGVQSQTRVLLRTLQRLQIPTLLFVNKIDRRGADVERVFGAIREKLTPSIVPMGAVQAEGERGAAFHLHDMDDPGFSTLLAERLADHDDHVLRDYLAALDSGVALSPRRLRRALARLTGRALVYPVYCGSAITGVGVEPLMNGIASLLPATTGDVDSPLMGSVFKVERGAAGEKIAYARIFSGCLRVRDRVPVRGDAEHKVTALSVFERGGPVSRSALCAGQIGRLWGLGNVQIGDQLGVGRATMEDHVFAPPTLESAIVPACPSEKGALHHALTQLAEQDPLIGLRQDDQRGELYVSLYGEVQKEVIQATLASEYGLAVKFRETTTICIERPTGSGEAVELLGKGKNPFLATVGLRVEPGAVGSGIVLHLAAELVTLPLFIYRSVEEFQAATEATVRETLRQGLCGWQVTDCLVTLTRSGYISPSSTAADFRRLTPLVLMAALQRAGTVVCEPIHRFGLEVPADTFGAVTSALARLRARLDAQHLRGAVFILEGTIPAARAHELQQAVPGLTRGEGILESAFDSYQPVVGPPPTRPRSDHNPLNRKEYLLHVMRRV
jgi:ribosomal protection tetracycline resistance protein